MHLSQPAARRLPLWLTASIAALLTACATTAEPPAPAPAAAPLAAAAPTPASPPKPAPDPRAQFKQLSDALAGAAVTVLETTDGRIRISVPSDLSFGLNSAEVQPTMGPVLDRIAESLNRHPETRAEIVGHTDTSGRPASNKALSLKRAESTREQLVSRQVAADRLTVKGMGQDEPVADNKTRPGRSANRRVEIFVSQP